MLIEIGRYVFLFGLLGQQTVLYILDGSFMGPYTGRVFLKSLQLVGDSSLPLLSLGPQHFLDILETLFDTSFMQHQNPCHCPYWQDVFNRFIESFSSLFDILAKI